MTAPTIARRQRTRSGVPVQRHTDAPPRIEDEISDLEAKARQWPEYADELRAEADRLRQQNT